MKSIILATIGLVGLSAAAPPAYHQYPRNYNAHLARDAAYSVETVLPYYKTVKDYVPRGRRDAAYSVETVLPYYKTVKEYVPRAAEPEPLASFLDVIPNIPKREAKPMPKYKQYKAPPKYGSRKKRQDLPAVPAVPEVPEVPSVPVIGSVAKRQVPDVSGLESELPTSTVPEIGSVA